MLPTGGHSGKAMAIDSQGMKWRGGVALIPGDQIRAIPQRQRSKGELAPLPSGAQFLNVIESVFGGMARAVIHNSNYLSVDECKRAIDRYFRERNDAFAKNPKRAGKVLGQGARAARIQRGEQLQGPGIPIKAGWPKAGHVRGLIDTPISAEARAERRLLALTARLRRCNSNRQGSLAARTNPVLVCPSF